MTSRGDVVLVPFDFTNRAGTKLRPAVVLSSDDYHATTPDALIAAITGNLSALPHPGDYRLADWRAAGLLRPSLVQMKLATIERTLIIRALGQLSTADLAAVERGLREALGL